jgi:hypothetical protein
MEHGEHCPTPLRGACLKYSTDGSRLGAEIAHTMGTTSEREIIDDADLGTAASLARRYDEEDNMSDEQREWESEDGGAWWP